MKVVVIGNVGPGSASWSTENDLIATLRSMGHEVVPMPERGAHAPDSYELARERVDAADLILWVSTPGNVTDGSLLARALTESKTPKIGMHLDLYRGLAREAMALASPFFKCDIVFTADGGAPAGWWEARGINHRWSPPGVLESSCYLAKPDLDRFPHEVVFVGSSGGYHGEHSWRRRMLEILHDRYRDRFATYDHGWKADRNGGDGIENKMRGHNLNVLYASAKVVVGDSCFAGRPEYSRYVSDRLFEAGGRGALQAFPSIAGVTIEPEPLMKHREHLLVFPACDEGTMIPLIDYALEMAEDERTAMRERSVAHVLAGHTYRHRIEAAIDAMRADGFLR